MENQTVYPNAPLREIDFEIKFNGEFSIIKNLDLFQDAFRSDYPRIFVPNAMHNKPYGLEPISFRSVDEKCGIFIALNKLGYYSFQYGGFIDFINKIAFLIETFSDLYPKVIKVNRIGLRYNNIILADDNDARIEDYLNIQFSNKNITQTLCDVDFENTYRINDIQLAIMCKTFLTPNKQKTIILDFDSYSENNENKINDVVETLSLCHQAIKDTFMGIITEKYRKFMTGEE